MKNNKPKQQLKCKQHQIRAQKGWKQQQKRQVEPKLNNKNTN